MNKWIKVSDQLPPENVVVETLMTDITVEPQDLKRVNKLWFLADGSMYVYYTPICWRHKS